MRYFSVFICLHILTGCSTQNNRTTYLENPNYIVWDETCKLNKIDFKAIEKPLDVKTINAVACCASTVSLEHTKNFRYFWDGKINNIKVISIFDCNRSWFDNSHFKNCILEHEQTHFDITELMARRLRKKIYFKPLSPKIIQSEFDKSIQDLDETQNKYDSDTKHGTLYNKQIEWQNWVQDELTSLSKYRNI